MKKERFKLIPACHLLLVKENQILLMRRFNTGYRDGFYSVLAGHLDGNESAKTAMAREAKEEAGIDIDENEIKFASVMHRKSDDERVDFFFFADKWNGKIKNKEPHKCDDLKWFDLEKLPDNIVPYVKRGIENYKNNISYDQFGWN
ncbi:NUDIX domain-containing protein [Candidatus Parcubacteria bacterium]|nr:NUDIX domain-containing protein [Candidatus Parcubacteria bacterium]